MDITVKPFCTRRDLRKFIHLPAKIHKGHENWIPPLYSDEWEFFNSEKNKSFDYCDVIMLLAYREEGWSISIVILKLKAIPRLGLKWSIWEVRFIKPIAYSGNHCVVNYSLIFLQLF